jgi:signal transduction histidine kinase
MLGRVVLTLGGNLVLRCLRCDDPRVSAASPKRSARFVAISASGVVFIAVLVALAVRTDSEAPSASPWLTAMDVAVGLAFVAAGVAARGPLGERALMAAVGPAWLAGSFLVGARSLHQAVLVVALVAFPAGRVRGVASWVLVALAGLAALGLVPQLGVAALFAGIAAVVLARWRADPAAAWYPVAAAAAVAAVLAWVWWIEHLRAGTFDATVTLLGYELVLLLVAAGFPLAAAAVLRGRARLADPLLSGGQVAGLDGLAVVLGDVLGDPDLRVYRWHAADAVFVDGRGQQVAGRGDRRWLAVDGPGGPVAVVAHRSSVLEDGPTAAAVAAAVRLAIDHLRLQEEQQERLGELEASRARLVAAADRQRARAAAELREEVQASLRIAQSELVAMRAAVHDPEAAAAIDVVVQELAAATRELADLVAGIPPADLGGGRLGPALHAVAETSPVPVTVVVAEDAAASQEAETALFYVCCEALANAAKHAGATRVAIALERQDDGMVATVADDGRGGADPSGSGLQGLADRLAACRGRLRVDSPPGAGTTVTATVPG